MHFRHDDTCFFALAVNMINLGNEALFSDGRIKDMFQVDGQHIEEAFRSSGTDGICRVIICCPCVCSIASSPVGETVEDTLVRVRFRAEENEVFERVRSARVVKDLGSNDEVRVCL